MALTLTPDLLEFLLPSSQGMPRRAVRPPLRGDLAPPQGGLTLWDEEVLAAQEAGDQEALIASLLSAGGPATPSAGTYSPGLTSDLVGILEGLAASLTGGGGGPVSTVRSPTKPTSARGHGQTSSVTEAQRAAWLHQWRVQQEAARNAAALYAAPRWAGTPHEYRKPPVTYEKKKGVPGSPSQQRGR